MNFKQKKPTLAVRAKMSKACEMIHNILLLMENIHNKEVLIMGSSITSGSAGK